MIRRCPLRRRQKLATRNVLQAKVEQHRCSWGFMPGNSEEAKANYEKKHKEEEQESNLSKVSLMISAAFGEVFTELMEK